jgi:hypothetical protein
MLYLRAIQSPTPSTTNSVVALAATSCPGSDRKPLQIYHNRDNMPTDKLPVRLLDPRDRLTRQKKKKRKKGNPRLPLLQVSSRPHAHGPSSSPTPSVPPVLAQIPQFSPIPIHPYLPEPRTAFPTTYPKPTHSPTASTSPPPRQIPYRRHRRLHRRPSPPHSPPGRQLVPPSSPSSASTSTSTHTLKNLRSFFAPPGA